MIGIADHAQRDDEMAMAHWDKLLLGRRKPRRAETDQIEAARRQVTDHTWHAEDFEMGEAVEQDMDE